jgi:hypothetical protein
MKPKRQYAGILMMQGLALLLSVYACGDGRVWAGPPLITDDPATPGRNHWEVNISHDTELAKDRFSMFVPLFDINYGLLENDQWEVEFPVRFLDREDQEERWGMGDILLGWKYRFLSEDKSGFMASVYPQFLAPTGSKTLGLGDGRTELLLPIEVGKHLCNDKLFVYAEFGYNVVFGQADGHAWKYGVAAEWKATERLEWLFEVGGFAFVNDGQADNPFFNGGLRYAFTDHIALIGSAGRSFLERDRDAPKFMSYLGFQFTWGGNRKM